MTTLDAHDAENLDFWRALRADLTIEGSRPSPQFEVGDTAALMSTLRFEGYVNAPAIMPPTFVDPLRECVKCLHERRIPLPFAFVYDEFWHAF